MVKETVVVATLLRVLRPCCAKEMLKTNVQRGVLAVVDRAPRHDRLIRVSTVAVQNGSGKWSWKSEPVELDAGTYGLRLVPKRYHSSIHPLDLVVYREGEEPEAPAQERVADAGVYLLGVELADDGENLRAMVEAEGGDFDNADSSEEISERLETITAKINQNTGVDEDDAGPARNSTPSPIESNQGSDDEKMNDSQLWLWLIVLLMTAMALILIVVWRKRRKRRAQREDEEKM